MHSIPDTESPQKIDNNNLTVTPVTYRNVIESNTYKGGGVEDASDDDEKISTEKPPVQFG